MEKGQERLGSQPRRCWDSGLWMAQEPEKPQSIQQVQILALPLLCCVTMEKLPNLSEVQIPQL